MLSLPTLLAALVLVHTPLHASGSAGPVVASAPESESPASAQADREHGEPQKSADDWSRIPDAQRGESGGAPDESEGARKPDGAYQSPYRLKFTVPESELLFDAKTKRGSVAEQSPVPESEWRSERLKEKLGS